MAPSATRAVWIGWNLMKRGHKLLFRDRKLRVRRVTKALAIEESIEDVVLPVARDCGGQDGHNFLVHYAINIAKGTEESTLCLLSQPIC